MAASEKTAEAQAAERFKSETAKHEMTVLHDDGLYRHLKFVNPERRWAYWFDLVTVPNALIFRGDGESFVFSRLPDMFEFFRGPVGRINPNYWAEKLTSDRGSVKQYDQTILPQLVKEHLEEVDDQELADKVRADLEDDVDNGMVVTIEGARAFLNRWDGRVWSDSWEWDLRDYGWWFLWACHAIVWGIGQYDAKRAATTESAAPALQVLELTDGAP